LIHNLDNQQILQTINCCSVPGIVRWLSSVTGKIEPIIPFPTVFININL